VVIAIFGIGPVDIESADRRGGVLGSKSSPLFTHHVPGNTKMRRNSAAAAYETKRRYDLRGRREATYAGVMRRARVRRTEE
jgi:hypothetical protein